MITRFDIPKEVTNVINVALECEVIDVQDIYALCSQFGDDWRKLVTEICEYAYCATRCTPVSQGNMSHKNVVTAADSFFRSVNGEYGVPA
jgi:hypothetical protein